MNDFADCLLAAGAENLALTLAFPSRPSGLAALAVLFVERSEGDLVPALNFLRATGEQDGEALFVFLARRKALTVNEDAWPKLPEKSKTFFDLFARVAFALVKDAPEKARVETRVVTPPRRKIEDTIFERGGSIGEKIGRGAFAAGQPTSTAQVHVQHPEPGRAEDPFAAFGGKNPAEWSEAEKLAFAEKMGMPAASPLTDRMATTAPEPTAKFKPRFISGFAEGERVEGQVFVSSAFDVDEDDGA